MFKAENDWDTLGAEALPGGLAEIHRILQPALEPALPERQIPERRGVRGFFARRKKQQDDAA